MSDESTLRERARQAIEAGKLPSCRPKSMWGGPGIGACCGICDKPVMHDETEFEIEFAQNDRSRRIVDYYHLHLKCFAAWEFERHKFEPTDGKISSTDGAQLLTPAVVADGVPESNEA